MHLDEPVTTPGALVYLCAWVCPLQPHARTLSPCPLYPHAQTCAYQLPSHGCLDSTRNEPYGDVVSCPEKHTKSQAAQHGCLPSLLGDGGKGIEKVFCDGKIFCTEPTRAVKTL